mmetsp:Transcript_11822/g.26064  ORF Transcript_11822/g.26064 Transcript_11822/m.26064 type:complete len:546 (-) Transcript_11822:225-1862(-)
MRFITGDDTGILKWVHVEAKKVERLPGSRRRGDAAEKLCWAGPPADRETRLAVGYESGAVEVRLSTSGEVLGTFQASPNVRCLQAAGDNLLVISKDGSGHLLKNWCAEEFTKTPAEGGKVVDENGEEKAKEEEGCTHFKLPGPVAAAELEPVAGSTRIAFGGDENDVKIFDLAKNEIVWKAKNMPNDFLELRIPLKISTVHWATHAAPAKSVIIVGTRDGKIRAYDTTLQKRPLFDMIIGYKMGKGTGGYTGSEDVQARPVKCATVHQTKNGQWSYFAGNTLGVLREFSMSKLEKFETAKIRPGTKRHWIWAEQQFPMRRAYRNITGSIRSIDVHSSGQALVAVGLGRFAYIFDTGKTNLISKVYLKQKLCSVLLSSDAYDVNKILGGSSKKDEDSDDEEPKPEDEEEGQVDGDEAENDVDDVQEGFSDDEGEAAAEEEDEQEQQELDEEEGILMKQQNKKAAKIAKAKKAGAKAKSKGKATKATKTGKSSKEGQAPKTKLKKKKPLKKASTTPEAAAAGQDGAQPTKKRKLPKGKAKAQKKAKQ